MYDCSRIYRWAIHLGNMHYVYFTHGPEEIALPKVDDPQQVKEMKFDFVLL